MSKKIKQAEKVFILYDGRAKMMDTEDCSILVSCSVDNNLTDGVKETLEDSKHFKGYDAIWYEYNVTEDNELVDEKRRDDLHRNLFL